MAVDTRGTPSRRVVVHTNVFELGELKTLAWRVFAAHHGAHSDEQDDDAAEAIAADGDERHDGSTRGPAPRVAFATFAERATQAPTALTAWQSRDAQDDPVLWAFAVNGAQPLPIEPSVRVVEEGAWSAESDDADATLAPVKQWLFAALRTWLAKKLLANGEFCVARELLCLNEARLVYRRPALARVNHFDVFLDEAFATSGVALHFEVLPTLWLCVNVEMIHQDATAAAVTPEITGLASAWMRLMGLPSDRDHSMVDVWHADDSLAARAVAETKYDDIYPRFRAFPRRTFGRRKGFDGGDDDANGNDDSTGKGGKADGNEHDGDDDNDGTNDGDDDMTRRNGALGKKKRRKPGTDAAENDESIIPVSPDTHVNSPDASGPVVGMTFPRERPMLLHTDHDIHVFKRRRRKKTEPTASMKGALSKTALLSFGPLTVGSNGSNTKSTLPVLGRTRTGPQSSSVPPKPETPKTPGLSLAVSLVASLTQDDEREVLDSKPLKVHPLLKALDDYVNEEMAAHAARNQVTTEVARARFVPNAPGFSPSVDEKKKTQIARTSSASLSYDQLKSQLLSDRFKRYLTGYYPRDFTRNKRQQRREHERKILLDFDENKLLEYAVSTAAHGSVAFEQHGRDQEIAMGVQLAALDALVPWRLHGKANTRWTPYVSPLTRAADARDTLTLAHHISPHLTELQGVVREKNGNETASDDEAGEVHDPWMTLERYCTMTNPVVEDDGGGDMHTRTINNLPRLCVATVESALHVEIPAISEYTLRCFQPVAAPKPVDYAIVCPLSPAQWLGTLTLSYLSMFRNAYAQSAMGDQAALDLSSMTSGVTVHVDSENAMLLVDCATSSGDAFATYRAAGEMLQPLLSQGIKRKQAFSRSPVANIIYLVAPFGRSDVKHKLWLLGAFGRGLFGEGGMGGGDDDWSKSVTLELLYLEDLIDVSIDANPYALLPAAIGLYDRIHERVTLKPIASGEVKSRYVCERLYHLADVQQTSDGKDAAEKSASFVHAGYSLSMDGKWLVAGFSDALGSVLETKALSVAVDGLSRALTSFVELAMEFVALMGEKATLVVSELVTASRATQTGADVWHELASADHLQELTLRFESVVSRVIVCQARFLEKESVQLRPIASTIVKVNEHEGVLVIRPDDASTLQERSRVANSKWLRSSERAVRQTAVLRVQHVHTLPVSDSTSASRDDLEHVLTEWSALSYLTTHPVTLHRQSPLPLHLAVVDELSSELELLDIQLTTDPLALRR